MIKRVLAGAIALVLAFSISACGGDDGSDGRLQMPDSSSDLEGKAYQDVVVGLKELGFTNVKTEALGDLITGWLDKPDEVDTVSADGDDDFTSGEKFAADVPILVSYHSFPIDRDEPSESPTPTNTAPAVLTAENNTDLASLLDGPEFDLAAAFSEQYLSQTISFDAQVAFIGPDDVKDFVDILILAGDYGPNKGPNFQVTGDPNYAGSNIPSNIAVGQNIRITAEVGDYDEQQGLFHLLPVLIEPR